MSCCLTCCAVIKKRTPGASAISVTWKAGQEHSPPPDLTTGGATVSSQNLAPGFSSRSRPKTPQSDGLKNGSMKMFQTRPVPELTQRLIFLWHDDSSHPTTAVTPAYCTQSSPAPLPPALPNQLLLTPERSSRCSLGSTSRIRDIGSAIQSSYPPYLAENISAPLS